MADEFSNQPTGVPSFTYKVTVFLAILLSSLGVMAQTYKWIDENGVVSYSQTPPSSAQAETLQLREQSQSDSLAAEKRLNELRQKLEDQRENRQLAKEAAEMAREEQRKKEQNCAAARSNLSKLETLGPRLFKTSEGEYVRLTEEQRQAKIKTAKQQIKLNCP